MVEKSRLPSSVMVAASTSSLDEELKPTSEPSKCWAKEPEVDEEPTVPVKIKRSSSAPEAPLPEKLPVVETISRPSSARAIESTSSPLEVRLTSEPPKYQLKVPVVVVPIDVGVKRHRRRGRQRHHRRRLHRLPDRPQHLADRGLLRHLRRRRRGGGRLRGGRRLPHLHARRDRQDGGGAGNRRHRLSSPTRPSTSSSTIRSTPR